MRANCVAAVEAVLGRKLKAPETQEIEQRITRNLRALAAEDPNAYRALTPAQQLAEAAERAGEEITAEHAKKQQRIAETIIKHDQIERVLLQRPDMPLDGIDALLDTRTDSKWNVQSANSMAIAIRNRTLGAMQAVTDYLKPTMLGSRLDPQRVRNFILELWGRDSGEPEAKAAAKAWRENTEILRQLFNAHGGDIGHLDNWHTPQNHSQLRVAKAGELPWIEAILPKLDRSAYYKENGQQMSDAELRATLSEVWRTIATGGTNKMKPGQFQGSGMRANRGNESRFLHFADPEGWLEYQKQFGDASFTDLLIRHVEGLSRDIGMVQRFGPNAQLQYQFWRDTAKQRQIDADPVNKGKYEGEAVKLDKLYNIVSGKPRDVVSANMAQFFDTLRSWMVATKLGSALWSSLPDVGTIHLTGHMNNLPEMQLIANHLAALNPANQMERRVTQHAGLGLDTIINSMNRMGVDTLAPNVAGKVAEVVMRASGLPAWTRAGKGGFGATMMSAIGSLVSRTKTLADLHPSDNRILLSKGFTEVDWTVMRLAKTERWEWGSGNNKMLTSDSIQRIPDADIKAALGPDVNPQRARDDASIKLLGAILEESNSAVPEPTARTRAITQGNVRGTLQGELYESMFLFKSFPIAMIQRHMARAIAQNGWGGKVGYIAALMASTTLMGAIGVQINELLSGRDPRKMASPRFALQALLKGGSLGIYGDFLFSEATQGGRGPLATALGPIGSLTEEAIGLTQGNIMQSIQGKDTHAGAEAVKFLKGNIPGQNLWYAKAALDHLIFQQLQEYASPGYLARQQRRAMREFGQSYWYQPGAVAPDRTPDLGAAIQ